LGEPTHEVTATVVWRIARELLASPPVTWNAFPFHPHPPGSTRANRSLTTADLAAGQSYLRTVLALFPDVPVLAVGRQAERALGVTPFAVLRHPAHGGATAFAEGLRAAARRLPAATT
jgi:hypothetical protein